MSEANAMPPNPAVRHVPVTVIVPVRNEAANIQKCLKSLEPAREVIVVDSASVDATTALAAEMGRATLQFQLQGSYPKKRQWVMDHHPLSEPWVMLIDADEEVTPALWLEISA